VINSRRPTGARDPTLARVAFELAQVNIGRLVAPLDDAQLAGFVALLEPVNAAADAAPGFVWRLQSDDGDATSIKAFEWDAGDSAGVIVNMSVWTGVQELAAFVFGDMHREVLRRRREWFHRMSDSYTVCWWVPAGHRPTTDEAEDRIRNLRAHGANPQAFTLKESYPRPDDYSTHDGTPLAAR
jgi:Domain of unknown function (DUF3291)